MLNACHDKATRAQDPWIEQALCKVLQTHTLACFEASHDTATRAEDWWIGQSALERAADPHTLVDGGSVTALVLHGGPRSSRPAFEIRCPAAP